jgi:hypothetical protein
VGRARSSWHYQDEEADMPAMVRALCASLVVVALLAAGCGSSGGGRAERSLEDPAGDVAAATGPDVVAVTVERDAETITFRVRFAAAPPLEVSEEEGWIDMLLIGIDVPPLGPPPAAPGGEWRGADYALGTHGAFESGMLVRLTPSASEAEAASEKRAEIPIATDGATLSLPVARDELGDPGTVAISIASAREWNEANDEQAAVTPDIVPDTGTWTVELEE